MSNHGIIKCKQCDAIIAQCRCMRCDKTISWSTCDKCKNMEKLSAQEIDQSLIDRDERKPVRKVMDDKVIPAAGVALGVGAAAAKAVANLKQVNRFKEVGN